MTPRELLVKSIDAWGLLVVASVEKGVVGKKFLSYKGNSIEVEWEPEVIDKMVEKYNHDAAVATVMFLLESVANRILEIDYKEASNADSN